MNDNFSISIRKMEREITCLKTSHDRGLGMVDFYTKSASGSITIGQWGITEFEITATVSSGELTPSLIQPQITTSGTRPVSLVSFTQSGTVNTWKYSAQGDVGATVQISARVVSSSKIATLTIGAV